MNGGEIMNTLFEAERIYSREEIMSLTHVRRTSKIAEDEIIDMLASSGSLLKGHFKLESGQHSSMFMRFADISGNSRYVNDIADDLISQLKDDNVVIDALLTQESAGRVLADRIADKLGKRMIVVESDERNRPTSNLINETMLYRGDKVLLVSDLITTGSALRKMAAILRDKKAVPVAAAVFATRNKKEIAKFEHEEHLKVYAVTDLAFEEKTYGTLGVGLSEKDCELCRKGKPAIPSWEL
jgi:orotate phosphoribosyltransferase